MRRPRWRGPSKSVVGGALCAGVLICAALPPWGWWPLGIAGVAWWSHLVDTHVPRHRYWVGWMVGFGWFVPSTLWMFKFTAIGWPVGVILWYPTIIGLVSVCAVGPLRGLALIGAATFAEWFRWHAPFGGVPLSSLAVTQAQGPLLYSARWVGTLGVAMLTVAAGVALHWIVVHRRAGVVLAGVVGLVAISALWAPHGRVVRSISVAAIQGGGAQQTVSARTDYREVLQRHVVAAEQGISAPVDLVVLPENIILVRGSFENSAEEETVQALAKRLRAVVLAGVVDDQGSDTEFYNYVVAIGPDGIAQDRYDKHRRVPFGEYVPMRSLIAPLGEGLLPRRDGNVGVHPATLDTSIGRIGCAISWETYFPRRIREAIHHNAEILTNPTNGSSYWLNQVQSQQVAQSTLRAVEAGRWMVAAAPTGFSAIIDPDGRVIARSGIGEAAVLQEMVDMRSGSTPAMVWGEAPALMISGLLIGTQWWKNRKGRDCASQTN